MSVIQILINFFENLINSDDCPSFKSDDIKQESNEEDDCQSDWSTEATINGYVSKKKAVTELFPSHSFHLLKSD